jgi:hypothetical protein
MAKTKKLQYCASNRKEYNKAMVRRESLTVWISEEIMKSWHNSELSGKKGASNRYTFIAIEMMASLGEIYHLPLRAIQGLTIAIFEMMEINLDVPDFSTLCRRRKSLSIAMPLKTKDPAIHMVVDSTGVKVYGEGEWKVLQYGYNNLTSWRELHIAIDEASKEILLAVIEGEIEQVTADSAYDR